MPPRDPDLDRLNQTLRDISQTMKEMSRALKSIQVVLVALNGTLMTDVINKESETLTHD